MPTFVRRQLAVLSSDGEQPLAFSLVSRPLRSVFEIQSGADIIRHDLLPGFFRGQRSPLWCRSGVEISGGFERVP
jgi:hypothetical protein